MKHTLTLLTALLLVTLSVAAEPDSAPNLLRVNPSFESEAGGHRNGEYQIEGWSGKNPRYGAHSPGDAAPGAGARGWKMENAGRLATMPEARAEVVAERRYTLSFAAQKPMTNPKAAGGVSTAIVWFDAAGKEVGRAFSPTALDGAAGTDWRIITQAAQAPAGAVRAGIEVVAAGGGYPNEDGRVYVLDDFRLMFTGEPEDKMWARVVPLFVEPGRAGALVVPYRITADRELAVRLVRGAQAFPEVRTKLSGPTRATTQVRYPVPAAATAANDYAWEVRLLPVGGAWDKPLQQRRVDGVFLDAKETGSGEIFPDHPQIIYEGRWDRTDAKLPSAFWMASSLHARFGGSSLKLLCDLTGTFANDQNLSLHVSIDGAPFTTVAGGRGEKQLLTLAEGLPDGLHTARILRNGPEAVGQWRIRSLHLDAGRGLARHAPFRPDRRIEVYGDSTVSGGNGGMFPNYSTTTARGLDASVACISKGGSGVGGSFIFNSDALYYWDRLRYNVFYDARVDTDGSGGKPDKPDDFHRNPYQPTQGWPAVPPASAVGPAWGPEDRAAFEDPRSMTPPTDGGRFTSEPKDVIIIGYGQNDQFVSDKYWVLNYRQLVTLLRKVYPRAHIFMTMTCMTGNQSFFSAAHAPLIADTAPGGLNADGHLHSILLYPSGGEAMVLYPGEKKFNHPHPAQHHDMAYGNVSWPGLIEAIGEAMDW
ncbi:MAG: hypothetical protein NTX87_16020 [Planctomycetota bacterium]|nr:hypothetical protein [Planctomycetota bacterium]